jgi:hypothetical protein
LSISARTSFFIAWAQLMILKDAAANGHKNFETFMKDLEEWELHKDKADVYYRKMTCVEIGYEQQLIRSCLYKMDSMDPRLNQNMRQVFEELQTK